MINRLINTKFVLSCGALACVHHALMAKLIEAPLYGTLVGAIVAGYMAVDYASQKALGQT